MTITGTGFTGATAVDFGTTAAATFTVNSDHPDHGHLPGRAAGTVDVTVTTAGGTSATSPADQFTYRRRADGDRRQPDAGPTGGGTSVTITGTDFTGATAVDFGTTAAPRSPSTRDTQITATSPAEAAGTVDVTVTTAGGTSPTSPADQFTYVAGPTVVSGVSPTRGPTGGGTSVTITGTGFTTATAVDFGTTAAVVHRRLRHPDHGHLAGPLGAARWT